MEATTYGGAAAAAQGTPAEGVPIPCERCAAPMREETSDAAQGKITVKCGYCNSREEMPADAAERVMALRARLKEIKAKDDYLNAPALAMGRLYVVYRKYILMAMAAIVVFSALDAPEYIRRFRIILDPATGTPIDVQQEIVNQQIVFFVMTSGALFGVGFGYIRLLRAYHRAMLPRLRARAPLQVGSSARCRCCGADLPASMEAFVACTHCTAQNLLTKELVRNRMALLQKEIEDYKARTHEMVERTSRSVANYRTYLYPSIYAAVGISATIGIAIRIAIWSKYGI
ncbi:hypothetical protein LZC95_15470 [Pendulispora brunnea]|uniref:Uncharacterized protein n=1 Tax=Pendulispora brunnea TaxID=2905690 RepID=A0ABZ2KLM5_9BACT